MFVTGPWVTVFRGKKDFRENAFTEIVVEHLLEIGMVGNGEVCYCETRVGRGIGKVSGFGFNDDGDTLEVFTSVFLDSGTPGALPSDDIRKATERAVRLVEACFGGIHKGMEVASDAHSMASRMYELEKHLDRIRVFVLSDGVDPTEASGCYRNQRYICQIRDMGYRTSVPGHAVRVASGRDRN